MSILELTILGTLGVVAALAAAFDVRERRIPNWLTVGALVVGLTLQGLQGWEALGGAVVAALLAFALALSVYLVGGFGGGDVKFLAAAGAFVGLDGLPAALFVTAVAGGLLAVVAVIRRGAVRRTLRNVRLLVILLVTSPGKLASGRGGRGGGSAFPADARRAVTVPYGVAIAVGALAGVLV